MTQPPPLEPKDEFQEYLRASFPGNSDEWYEDESSRLKKALQSYVEERVRLAVQKERSQMLIIDTKRIEVNPKSHHYIKLETEEGND